MLTGRVRTLELDVTEEQLEAYESRRLLLQEAFPQLTAAEREFIKTGITPEEWERYVSDPGDE